MNTPPPLVSVRDAGRSTALSPFLLTQTAMGWRMLTAEGRRLQPFVDWAFRLICERRWPFENFSLLRARGPAGE